MDNILFIYNIVLTFFFTIAFTGFYVIYMKNRKRGFLFLALLYLLLIIDNSTTYISEFSKSFKLLYETTDMIYIIIYLIYFAIILNSRMIVLELFDDKFTTREKQLYIVIPIILWIIYFFAPYEIGEVLLYISFFAALCYIPLRVYRNLSSSSNRFDEKMLKKYKLLVLSIIILSILAIIDSSIYYVEFFGNDSLNPTILEYRNIFFDMLKLLICVVGIRSLYISFETQFDKKNIDEKLNEFCMAHSLTNRQKEIIALIIDGCSNKEIGDKLHITEGTVKTHIYNIFKKTDVSSRNQILKKIIQD